jgi:integrase/recombinase XerC
MSSVQDYLEWMELKGFSGDTIAGRRRFFARLERELDIPLEAATAAILTEWRAGLTVSDRAVIRYVSHLRVFYGWAVGYDLRADNPASRIPVPRSGRLLPRPVSHGQLTAAVTAAEYPVRLWLILAAWAGLRAKEIALLRRENILDTAPEPVLLVAADATKGHSERVVPLKAFVVAELAAAPLPPWGFAFPRADGRPGPNRPSRISQRCGDFLRREGLAVSLHQFRHWFGTEAWRASRDLRLVQELLGHQSPVTTAGYTLYSSAAAAAAVAALPELSEL